MQYLGNDQVLDVVMQKTILWFNPLTNENITLATSKNDISYSSLYLSDTNSSLMTFGNVLGKISIFDVNKRKTITTNDYSL